PDAPTSPVYVREHTNAGCYRPTTARCRKTAGRRSSAWKVSNVASRGTNKIWTRRVRGRHGGSGLSRSQRARGFVICRSQRTGRLLGEAGQGVAESEDSCDSGEQRGRVLFGGKAVEDSESFTRKAWTESRQYNWERRRICWSVFSLQGLGLGRRDRVSLCEHGRSVESLSS